MATSAGLWPRGEAAGSPSPLDRAAGSDAAMAAAAVCLALVAAFAVANGLWEFLIAFVAVFGSVALYLCWPTAGLTAVLVLWVVAPFLRRLFDYFSFSLDPDVLSIAPFVATGLVGMIAWRRARPSPRATMVFGVTCAGLAVGLPVGLLDPMPLAFATLAYGSAACALFIGYADGRRDRPVIDRVLLGLLPLVAAYALYQYLSPRLPGWDELWIRTSGIKTIGDKDDGTFRAFGTLNSPVTLATFTAMVVAMAVVAARLGPVRIAGAAAALAVLFFTGVRSAWLALGVTLVALVLVTGGRVMARVLVLLVILGGLYFVAGGSTAGQQVIDRASTLTTLSGSGAETDVSLTQRLNQVTVFGPRALAAPLGHGLGSVGQAAKVSSRSDAAPFADNGFLMLLWQVGPGGFLLVVGALGWALVTSLRGGSAADRARRLPYVAPLVAGGVLMLASDSLYGLSAVIIWYCVGALLSLTEAAGRR